MSEMENSMICFPDAAAQRVGQRPKEWLGREVVFEYQQGRMETMTTTLDNLMSVVSCDSIPPNVHEDLLPISTASR